MTTESSEKKGIIINGFTVVPSEAYSVQEAADILDRSLTTIYRMVENKEIEPIFRRGERGRISIWGKAIIHAANMR